MPPCLTQSGALPNSFTGGHALCSRLGRQQQQLHIRLGRHSSSATTSANTNIAAAPLLTPMMAGVPSSGGGAGGGCGERSGARQKPP